MATVTNPMQKLEHRLVQSGFPRPFIKTIIPGWWDESLDESAQSVLLLKMHLSKHLGLDLASLVDDEKSIGFRKAGSTHYRLTQSKSAKDVVIAQSMAESLARLVASAAIKPYIPIPENPEEVRKEILSSNQWVSLDALLRYLWEHGIPVIHLKKLPTGAKIFDGLVVDVEGRPVIVLARGNKAPAWQLFILAHEVGHIGSGHVKTGTVFFDEKVKDADEDQKEVEATQYGLHLLNGVRDAAITADRYLKADALAWFALRLARENHIDPGHVVLNYGHTMDRMKVAQIALKKLPEQYPSPEHITATLHREIDLSLLPEDSKDVLEILM